MYIKFKENDYQVAYVCSFLHSQVCSLLQFSKEFTPTAKKMPMPLEVWITPE